MQKAIADVKSQSNVVGQAEYYVFDSVQEAIDTLGEETTLGLINSQHRTNAMNEVRAKATQKPTKAYLRREAMTRMTADDWMACHGDGAKIEAMIEAKMAEVEAELLAQTPRREDDENGED